MNLFTVLTELFWYWVYSFDNLKETVIIFLELPSTSACFKLWFISPFDLKVIFYDLSQKLFVIVKV